MYFLPTAELQSIPYYRKLTRMRDIFPINTQKMKREKERAYYCFEIVAVRQDGNSLVTQKMKTEPYVLTDACCFFVTICYL